jgi:RNA polymerase sigma-70 factor (ECF subfamily)
MRVTIDRFEILYREGGPRLWRALVAFSGDREIAADAMAEAFAQAIARGDAIRDPTSWVWRVSFVLVRSELKRRTGTTTLDVEPGFEHPEPLPHVFVAIHALPEKQRLAIVLHDYADRPTDEVAGLLGCSRATVHVHLSQGRRRLRKLLQEPEVTDE